MIHDDFEQTANVFDLIKLAQIPKVREVLAAQLEQAGSGGWKKYIEDYKKTKTMCYEALFAGHFRVKGKKRKTPPAPLYWFEVTRYWDKVGEEPEDAEWRITHLLDAPDSQVRHWVVPPYDILPRDVIFSITNDPHEAGKVFTLEGVKSKRTGKTMDVKYLFYSDTMMMGTVRHRGKVRETPAPSSAATKAGKVDKENAYRVFHRCLQTHREEVKGFTREFMLKWLKQQRAEAGQGEKNV
jgi:hypothetical protein